MGLLTLDNLVSPTMSNEWQRLFLILVLQPVKIISLILSRVKSLGGVKTGDPREKTPDQPQAGLGWCHMWPELGSNPQMTSDLEC